ncbi:RAB3A interacting protein [Coemansia sp. RSA 2711]|nr:RAB3A interacting protein [Coemansia sp. RSA 2711]
MTRAQASRAQARRKDSADKRQAVIVPSAGADGSGRPDRKGSRGGGGLPPLDTSAAALKGGMAAADHLVTPTDSNPERSDGSLDGGAVERAASPGRATFACAYLTEPSAASYCEARRSTAHSETQALRSGGPPSPSGSRSLPLLTAEPKPRLVAASPPPPALATPPLTAASSLSSPQMAASAELAAAPPDASALAGTEPDAAGDNQAAACGHKPPAAPGSAHHATAPSRPMSSIVLVAATAENTGRGLAQRETNWFRRQSKSISSGADTPSKSIGTGAETPSRSIDSEADTPSKSTDSRTDVQYEARMLRAQAQRDAAMAEAAALQQQLGSSSAEVARLSSELAAARLKQQREYELRTAAEAKCSAMECELAELSSNIQFEAQSLVAHERRAHKRELERAAQRHGEVAQLLEMERAQVGALKLSLERASTELDRERSECARLRGGMAAFERQFSSLMAPGGRIGPDGPAPRSELPPPENPDADASAHIAARLFFGNDAARADTRLAEFLGFINAASEKEAQGGAFMQRSLREDVAPTLAADSAALPSLSGWTRHRRLLHSVQDATLVLESYVPRLPTSRVLSVACFLCGGSASRVSLAEPRLSGRAQSALFRMRFGDGDGDNKPLCSHCHARMVAVCSFFAYLKIVRRGLIKRPIADIWLEVNRARLLMWLARSGASPDCELHVAHKTD